MKRGRNQRRRPGGGNNPNRALDSNGPDVRIRGTANQIYDKYQQLARDASSAGDRVKAESYLQHAEHYFRVIRAMQPAQQPNQQGVDGDNEQPSIEDGDQDQPQREGRRDQRERRQNNGAANNGSDDKETSADDSGAGDEPKAAAEKEPAEEEKKPRRRRAPRRTAKKDDDSAADEAPAAAAAE